MSLRPCRAWLVLCASAALSACPSSVLPGAEDTSSSGAGTTSTSLPPPASGAASSSGGAASSAPVASSQGGSGTSVPGSGASAGGSSADLSGVSQGASSGAVSGGASSGGLASSAALASSSVGGGSSSACATGSACTLAGGGAGLLDATCACVACTSDAPGDAACQAAYGTGQLCIGGACVAGNCRSPADCSAGQLCSQNACSPCQATADCTAAAAYGAGHVCNAAGACVPGDCVTSADCTGAQDGQVCTAANRCSACGGDNDCVNDAVLSASDRTICVAGVCTSNVCTASGSPAMVTYCPGNTQENVCCPPDAMPTSTVGTCVPNTKEQAGAARCCGTGQGSCANGQTCSGNYCTACQPVPTTGPGANTYFIHPQAGNDSATGFNAPGCQFRTLGRALTFVNQPGVPVTLVLLGDASTATGERFNHVVPANVRIMGGAVSASGADATITPTRRTLNLQKSSTTPDRLFGFRFTGSNSGLSHINLDAGTDGTGTLRAAVGVSVVGAGLQNVTLSHMTIRNMALAGVAAGEAQSGGSGNTFLEGAVTVGPAVRVEGSGNGVRYDNGGWGVVVAGLGTVTLAGGTGEDRVVLSENNVGVVVGDAGVVRVAAPDSNVVVTQSRAVGVAVGHTPGDARLRTVDLNGITVVSTAAPTGDPNPALGSGIVVGGGSRLKLRNATVLANAGSGIYVARAEGGTSNARTDLSGIDLGATVTGDDRGGNTLQAPLTAPSGRGRNQGAGICLNIGLELSNAQAQSLRALGNTLVANNGTAAVCDNAPTTVVLRRNLGSACTTPTNAIPTSVGIEGGPLNAHRVNVSSCALSGN